MVAVDRNPAAPGLRLAHEPEVVDFADVAAVEEVARRHAVDGVLTVSADRAVPVVAAVAERLGLPTIGAAVAGKVTHKGLMRRALDELGVPQPPFAVARTPAEAHAAVATVGLPAVLKPADSGGQRGVFRIDSPMDVERDFAAAWAESAAGEVVLEAFVEGMEMNGIVVARGGEARTLTLSDRRRPPGIGFGVGWTHVYPPTIPDEQHARASAIAEGAVQALGLHDGIAFPQLIAHPDGDVVVVEVAARIPGGQMADLVYHAVGVDLVEVALRQALGEEVPDELALARFSQPLAIRFFTARPGPLPTGRVTRIGTLDPVLACEGAVQAETYLQLGEVIRPVRLDGDRRGYVIAIGDTNVGALARAELAATKLHVETEPA